MGVWGGSELGTASLQGCVVPSAARLHSPTQDRLVVPPCRPLHAGRFVPQEQLPAMASDHQEWGEHPASPPPRYLQGLFYVVSQRSPWGLALLPLLKIPIIWLLPSPATVPSFPPPLPRLSAQTHYLCSNPCLSGSVQGPGLRPGKAPASTPLAVLPARPDWPPLLPGLHPLGPSQPSPLSVSLTPSPRASPQGPLLAFSLLCTPDPLPLLGLHSRVPPSLLPSLYPRPHRPLGLDFSPHFPDATLVTLVPHGPILGCHHRPFGSQHSKWPGSPQIPVACVICKRTQNSTCSAPWPGKYLVFPGVGPQGRTRGLLTNAPCLDPVPGSHALLPLLGQAWHSLCPSLTV